MKKLNAFIAGLAKVVTRIVEVFHWVGVALMVAATVCSVAAPSAVNYFVGLVFDKKKHIRYSKEVKKVIMAHLSARYDR